jgi:Family of unknown function (DUF5994)
MTTPMPREDPVAGSAATRPRTVLRTSPAGHDVLDGAWWPRSHDLLAELPDLIGALNPRVGRVRQIMVCSADWRGARFRRLSVGGDTVRVGWFATLGPHLLIILGERDIRLDLLVVPPGTADDVAHEVMAAASSAGTTVDAVDAIVTRLAQIGVAQEHADQEPKEAIAVRKDEAGSTDLNGHARADTPASTRIR